MGKAEEWMDYKAYMGQRENGWMTDEWVLSHVIPRFLPLGTTKVENMPYRVWNTMTIIYVCVNTIGDLEWVEVPLHGKATYNVTRVNSQLCDYLHIVEEELFEHALENMKVFTPVKLESLGEFIEKTTTLRVGEKTPVCPLWGVSNEQVIHGSTYMLHTDLLVDLAQRMQTEEMYIMPLCLHSFNVVSKSSADAPPEEYKKILMKHNETSIKPQDRLSDHVLVFNASTKEIRIIA